MCVCECVLCLFHTFRVNGSKCSACALSVCVACLPMCAFVNLGFSNVPYTFFLLSHSTQRTFFPYEYNQHCGLLTNSLSLSIYLSYGQLYTHSMSLISKAEIPTRIFFLFRSFSLRYAVERKKAMNENAQMCRVNLCIQRLIALIEHSGNKEYREKQRRFIQLHYSLYPNRP